MVCSAPDQSHPYLEVRQHQEAIPAGEIQHQERFPGRKAGNPDGWNEWKLTSPGTIGNIE